MSTRRRRASLTTRLFAGQLLVIVAGSLTLALVALAIAPGLFRTHARQALTALPPDVVGHLQQAFQDAILVALAIATIAATVTALAASWLLAQRLTRPIRTLNHAAEADQFLGPAAEEERFSAAVLRRHGHGGAAGRAGGDAVHQGRCHPRHQRRGGRSAWRCRSREPRAWRRVPLGGGGHRRRGAVRAAPAVSAATGCVPGSAATSPGIIA
jgi:hypothetical protein